jgi:hypothetical protein
MEHLILKGTALRHQMKKAEKKFKEVFVEPVREYLRGCPDNKTVVLGIASPLLRINKAKAQVNENLVLEEIRTMVSNGKLSASDLATMVLNGSLGIGDPDLAADTLAAKLSVDPSVFTELKVTKKEDSVQWNTVKKGDILKLTDGFKRLHDLEGTVAGAATRSLPSDVLKKLQQP